MQLSFIELLYVSAQPLHKSKDLKAEILVKVMQSVLALLGRGKVSLGAAW
jgi:hypothetical protein